LWCFCYGSFRKCFRCGSPKRTLGKVRSGRIHPGRGETEEVKFWGNSASTAPTRRDLPMFGIVKPKTMTVRRAGTLLHRDTSDHFRSHFGHSLTANLVTVG